jgi:cyanamide hydratase
VILNEQFPKHAKELSASTLALTSLLHDLGTTTANMSATRMSFEFYGALKARDLLLDSVVGASQDAADAAFEAIIRHQDLGTEGNITFLGQVIQLATIYDNVGGQHPTIQHFDLIIHQQVREDVIRMFPRKGWLGCFAGTVREEVERKPWSHTTHIPGFAEKIEGNDLMKPYE